MLLIRKNLKLDVSLIFHTDRTYYKYGNVAENSGMFKIIISANKYPEQMRER